MPSQPIPCAGCGKPRRQGGKSSTGVCRDCFENARRERAAHPKAHIVVTTRKDRAAALPTDSWWATPEYQRDRTYAVAVLAAQLPRILSVEVKVPKPHAELF